MQEQVLALAPQERMLVLRSLERWTSCVDAVEGSWPLKKMHDSDGRQEMLVASHLYILRPNFRETHDLAAGPLRRVIRHPNFFAN